jgi:hypothetical protein
LGDGSVGGRLRLVDGKSGDATAGGGAIGAGVGDDVLTTACCVGVGSAGAVSKSVK